MVEGVAQTACSEMAELLTERPEQEQFLLAALVNRLGHPQHRVGAKVAQMLELLVQKHPNMRLVVVKEIEQIIFRSDNLCPTHFQYPICHSGKTFRPKRNVTLFTSSAECFSMLANLNWPFT